MKGIIIIGATMLVFLSGCDKLTEEGWVYKSEVDKLTQVHSASATKTFVDKDVRSVRVDVKLTCKANTDLNATISTYDLNTEKDGMIGAAPMSYYSDKPSTIQTRSGKNTIFYLFELSEYTNEVTFDLAHPDLGLSSNVFGAIVLSQHPDGNNIAKNSASKMIDNHWIIRIETKQGNPTITMDLNDSNVKKVTSQCKWNPAFSGSNSTE